MKGDMKPSDTDWLEKAFRDHREERDRSAPSWEASLLDRGLWLQEARRQTQCNAVYPNTFSSHSWAGWWMKWASGFAALAVVLFWGGRVIFETEEIEPQASLSRVSPPTPNPSIMRAEPMTVPEGVPVPTSRHLDPPMATVAVADALVAPATVPGPRNQIDQAQVSGRFISVTNWGRSEGLEEEPGGMARFTLRGTANGFEWKDENGDLYLGRLVNPSSREDSGGSNRLSFVAHGTNRSLGRRLDLDGTLWIRSNSTPISGGLPPLDQAVLEYRARWGGSNAMSWRAILD